MQLQFNKTSIRCLETVLQQAQNGEVTQELRLPEGMPDIGRVLTTWGQIVIRSKQWQADTIQVTGGVLLWTLYAPEDGTEPRSVDSWLPFQLSWSLPEPKREGPMRVLPLLSSADSRSISARKLMLRANVSVLVQAMSPMEAEIYSSGEIPDDVQLLKRTYPLRIPVEGGEKPFLIDEELILPEIGIEAQKLLSLTVSPDITEKRVLTDKVIFKGILTLRTVCRYEDGEIRSADLTVQFSQMSDLDSTYGSDAGVDIRMAVTSLEADMPQNGKVRFKCGLVAQYLLDDRHVLELVQDAYSTQRQIELEGKALRIPAILDERMEYLQAEQSIPSSGRVADVRFMQNQPQRRQTAQGVDLELSGHFNLLAYEDDGMLHGMTSRWEGTMQLCADGCCDPLVTVKPTGRVQITSSADDLNMSTQLQISMQTGKMEQLPMITAIELGAMNESESAAPSVILLRGSGELLWNLAKQSNSTVSAICDANGIETDVAPDRMILIPIL